LPGKFQTPDFPDPIFLERAVDAYWKSVLTPNRSRIGHNDIGVKFAETFNGLYLWICI